MLNEFFNLKIPESFYSLKIKDYIKENYIYYNHSKLEETVLTILHNLIQRKSNILSKKLRYVLVRKNPNEYPIQNFTYHNIINAVQILKNLNIITEITGDRKYTGKNKITNEWIFINPMVTQIFLNPKETWNIDRLNISWLNLTLALNCYRNPEQLKSYCRTKFSKKEYIDDETNISYIDSDLDYINNFLIKKGYPNLQYKRIFGTDIDKYGRFWNQFQSTSKIIRKKICEQEDWLELDFKSCIVNTLYLIETEKLYEGDIYIDFLKKTGLPIEFREVMKKILSISLNTKDKKSAIKSVRNCLIEEGLYSKYTKEFNLFSIDRKNIPYYLKYLLKASNIEFLHLPIFTIIPEFLLSIFESDNVLNKHLYTNSSTFTQNIESNCLNKILLYLIKDKILPLSIHDCFFIPSSFKDKYIKLMYFLLKQECFNYKNSFSFKVNYKFDSINQINSFNYNDVIYKRIKNALIKNIITFQIWKSEYG